LFTSFMLLKILEKEKRPLSYLINELPKYPSLDFRLKCSDEKKFKVVKRLKKMFKGYKLILIDGVGVKFKNGFALVRASNTEPKIELRCEAKNNLELLKVKNEMMKKLKIAMKL
ncbi:MAG: phosphomannomutase, partial [Candidatus Aenigmatarchaeota archaeon]